MAWLRWHEGTVNDPKFMVVSRKSGQPVGFVLAVWAMILERASSADERGSISGFDCESADAVMGMPDGAACAIIQAMQDKGLINDGFVCRWAERQPVRERGDEAPSTDRVRKHRERQKENRNANLDNETPCNAMEHHETPRGEEIRREENKEENTEEGGDTSPAPAPSVSAVQSRTPRQPKPEVRKISHGEYQRVKLTEDEYTRLEGRYGADTLAAAIIKLDLHIEGKGRDEYKNHAAAMQKWVFAAVEQDRARTRASPSAQYGGGSEWKSTAQRRHDANKAECEKFINGDLDFFGVSNAGQ